MKICSKCKIEKQKENFYKNKKAKDGLQHECKNCRKEYLEEYYKENKERISQKAKEYYEENKEQLKKNIKEYKKENREKISQKNKEYRIENIEQIKEYRKQNIEKINQREKEYCDKNRERIIQRKRNFYQNNRTRLLEQQRQFRQDNKEIFNKRQREYVKERRKNNPNLRIAHSLRTSTRSGIIGQGGVKSASTEKLLGCTWEEARIHIEKQFVDGMSWENYPEWEIDHIRPLMSFDLTDPEQQRQACHYSNLQPMWAAENRSKGSLHNGIRHFSSKTLDCV